MREHESILDRLRVPGVSMGHPINRTELFGIDHRPPLMPRGRDPESFYFDDWPAEVPVNSGDLTAELWRHQSSPEVFEMNVSFEADPPVEATIACEVHASNLTQPAKFFLRLQSRSESVSAGEIATEMANRCTTIGAMWDAKDSED